MACARGAGAAICATTAPECDWVCGPLAWYKFGATAPADDPEVVCGAMACARGAGERVYLIWCPWHEIGYFFVPPCFCSPSPLLLVFPRTPSGTSQSSCFSLQLLILHVPLL